MRAFCVFGWSSRVALTLGKTIKTAFGFSIIDFYFVTGFYHLYDICMVTFLHNDYLINHFIAHSAKGDGHASIPQFCCKLRNEKRMRFLGW